MPVETLKNALDYYFRIFFCPDYDTNTYSNFYKMMFEAFPMETVLRTLVRVSLEAKEKKQIEH